MIGSWVGFIFNCLVLVAQFWVGFAPVDYGEMTGSDRVNNFFNEYLAVSVVLAFYIPYKIYTRSPFMRAKDMDLRTGRRDLDIQHLVEEERAERTKWPVWKRVYKFFF